jgi:hypothetical protein
MVCLVQCLLTFESSLVFEIRRNRVVRQEMECPDDFALLQAVLNAGGDASTAATAGSVDVHTYRKNPFCSIFRTEYTDYFFTGLPSMAQRDGTSIGLGIPIPLDSIPTASGPGAATSPSSLQLQPKIEFLNYAIIAQPIQLANQFFGNWSCQKYILLISDLY